MDKRNTQVLHKGNGVVKYNNKNQKSRIEMQLFEESFDSVTPKENIVNQAILFTWRGGPVNVVLGFIIY